MNIIQIRNKDTNSAHRLFAEFMDKAEHYLNDKAHKDYNLYKKCSGYELEKIVLEALRDVSVSTPFRREEISLVSGAKFPDIVAERHYGVEVKSTKEDSWKSTGSSIVENTRIEDVERIYLMFGKLGGQHPQFLCKPYQDCLSKIAVTHSPRYLIDMELSQNNTPTIFDKMGTDYDTFRLLSEHEKVKRVRLYYKSQAQEQGKIQMPWWIGEHETSSPVLSLYTDLPVSKKNEIVTRMFILFPDEVLNSDYKRAALWMCSRFSVIMPNMRDLFSAGGKIDVLGKNPLPFKMPQVLNRLFEDRESIITLLKHPDSALLQDIAFCWTNDEQSGSLLDVWINKTNQGFVRHKDMGCLNIKDLFGDVL